MALIKSANYEPKRLQWLAELNDMGEQTVRDLLANGRASSTKTLWAQQWLDEIDQERSDALDAKREASQSEQTEIARSARDAAWSAADAAREAATAAREQALAAKTANTIATVALIAAIIAMAISIIGLFVQARPSP